MHQLSSVDASTQADRSSERDRSKIKTNAISFFRIAGQFYCTIIDQTRNEGPRKRKRIVETTDTGHVVVYMYRRGEGVLREELSGRRVLNQYFGF